MSSISNIIRKNWGEPQIISQDEAERQLKTANYLKKINTPTEKRKREPLTEDQLKKMFQKKANEITGGFEYNPENTPVIEALFYYFTKNPKFYETKVVDNEASLNKGLLLIGNTGSGKTTVLDIFKALKWQGFRKFSTKDVVKDFGSSGEEGIKTYFKGNIYFDDLGAELEAMHYGKREELGARLLEERYTLFTDLGTKTHATSNLSHKQLTDKYGFRLEGRILEMFNIIYLGKKGNSIDFRIKNHK